MSSTRNWRTRQPEVIGNDYTVVGTFDRAAWKAGLRGDQPRTEQDPFAPLTEFKRYRSLDFDPGGYRLPDAPPERFIIRAEDAQRRRDTPWTRARRP
jgi:hypothetical protein